MVSASSEAVIPKEQNAAELYFMVDTSLYPPTTAEYNSVPMSEEFNF